MVLGKTAIDANPLHLRSWWACSGCGLDWPYVATHCIDCGTPRDCPVGAEEAPFDKNLTEILKENE